MRDFYEQVHSEVLTIKNESKVIIIHPASILTVGGSGTEKTNWLMNRLDDMNCFTKYYVYAKILGCDPMYDNALIPKLREVEKKQKAPLLMATETSLDNPPKIEDLDNLLCKAFIYLMI